jgi:hypothetical protein
LLAEGVRLGRGIITEEADHSLELRSRWPSPVLLPVDIAPEVDAPLSGHLPLERAQLSAPLLEVLA